MKSVVPALLLSAHVCLPSPGVAGALPEAGRQAEQRLARLLDLMTEECRFDYCGLDGPADAAQCRQQASRHEARRFLDLNLDDFDFRRSFLDALKDMESCGRSGDRERFSSSVCAVAEKLSALDPKAAYPSMDKWRFCECVERVEHSLARLVLQDPSLLAPEDIYKTLPDALFLKWRAAERDFCEKTMVFRDMLSIGARIRDFRRGRGRFPDSLDELDRGGMKPPDIAKSMSYHYRREGDGWMLFCGGPDIDPGRLPFDVYVPVMRGKPVYWWAYGGCVWFSSTYAEKRKTLYERGSINVGTNWECHMKDGVVTSRETEPPEEGR